MRHCLLATLLMLTHLASAAERPNVILVMCDDLGYGDPRCFNPESRIDTPHIDSMASSGLKFTRFYSAAPVCSPTRGSCLTGRHPYRYGVYSANTGHLKKGEITLPELLKRQGYATGHYGKWHLGTLTKTVKDANRGGPRGAKHFSPPSEHGYDDSFVTESKVPTYDPMVRPIDANSKAWNAIPEGGKAVDYGTRYWDHQGVAVTENLRGDDSRIIMDRAIPFIEKATEAGQPFFTVIWFHAPHLPVVASPERVAPYAQFSEYERNYYGCVSALDEQVGRLRSRLRELGVAEQTMLWFCSDNGPEGQTGKAPGSAGELRGRKRSLYEGGVRVPAILEWPGAIGAGVTNVAAVTSDFLPTTLDVLGITYPDDRPIDGVSLLPILTGQSPTRGAPIGFQSAKQVAWHNGDFKIYSGDNGKTWELYNLAQDINESNDLAKVETKRLENMIEQAKRWQASCKQSDGGSDYDAK